MDRPERFLPARVKVTHLGDSPLPGRLMETGYRLPATLSFDDWRRAGQALQLMHQSVMWWVGDWLVFGEKKWGEMYTQALDDTNYEYQALRDAKWVCSQIELSRRRDNLTFSHHREVAPLEPPDQDRWLDRAAQEGWSRNELRLQIAADGPRAGARTHGEGCTVADLEEVIRTGKTFGAVYADPPWRFEVYSGKGKARSAEQHYDTMSVDEIRAVPVSKLASDDCALFLWTVMPQIPEALSVLEAWGFAYKTCAFVWAKQNRGGEGFFTGMGYWTRANAEICLLGTRGSPERLSKSVRQLVVAPVGAHSKKPQAVRAGIEQLVDGPYLELFGRDAVPGWAVWGNEAPLSSFLEDAEVST